MVACVVSPGSGRRTNCHWRALTIPAERTATARHVRPGARSVGEVLLHAAREARTGLLVMGAYSHSRLRELLLGGVTRHVLTNVTVTPIFLAH